MDDSHWLVLSLRKIGCSGYTFAIANEGYICKVRRHTNKVKMYTSAK